MRVGEHGEISYKKIPIEQILGSIQLGIQNTIRNDCDVTEPNLIMPDFVKIDGVDYPKQGSIINNTPPHEFQPFVFKTYAPIIFHRFRHYYGIKASDYTKSICTSPLKGLPNPGASGSLFYKSQDDQFIIKTVQLHESLNLRKLLYGFYLNFKENPQSYLPKFYGLYRYQSYSLELLTKNPTYKVKNIRLVIMNNLIPSNIEIHEKYDLKGSTKNRSASEKEKLKPSPTFKDLNFNTNHPGGFYLKPDTYATLIGILKNDCRVLESFQIMDYSLLMGVHFVNRVGKDAEKLKKWKSLSEEEKSIVLKKGIEASSASGEKLVLFVGIIDVLQDYSIKKNIEHNLKAILYEKNTVSVQTSEFYAKRFLKYMTKYVQCNYLLIYELIIFILFLL